MSKKIAVLDGNSLMHRAYHAIPATMSAPDGTPTNAVFGFISMLLKFIDTASPDALICAFDIGRPQFRMEVLEEYKAQRPSMDNELRVQFPVVEELLEAMEIPVIKLDGWEGDDILGTIAARNEGLGYETLLVTGDKDTYQLVSDLTRVVTTKKGISDIAIYGPAEVVERYGIEPSQIPDFLGLKGDPSDNIPGVPGIGEKTATKLLQAYGSLEGLYENLDKLKGKQLENVRDNKEVAFASRRVATIVRDLEFPLDLEEVSFPSFSEERASEAFEKIRFNAHLDKVLKLIGVEAKQKEVSITFDPIVHDIIEAGKLLDRAASSGERVGLAVVESSQASLFESPVSLACGTKEGSIFVEGNEAKVLFARIVRELPFACLDVKQAIKSIYPADTLKEALVDERDLMEMDAFDLGLAGYVLDSSAKEYSLSYLADHYLGALPPEEKDEEKNLVIAAAVAKTLLEPLQEALEKDGSIEAYQSIDLPLVSVLSILERTGAAIDVDHLANLGKKTGRRIDELQEEIHELAGETFNIDSPKQLSHILFEVIGLAPKKKTQTGYSTDASVLKELSREHPLPKLILEYRELAKIKSTYIDALPRMRAEDGRVHTTFNETVTTTGRLSSSDPNLQNIPVRTDFGRQIRECFVPLHPNEMFLSADYSQIELRLLAHLSEDPGLIEAFNSGMDFHKATAARVFGLDADEIGPELRSRAKAVNFGIVYGQQAYGLSQVLDIPFEEARNMIDRYFEIYPQVRTYLDRAVSEAREKGYAETMFGRKRHIRELKSKNATQRGFGERTAMNHPMQGSAADIIKLAMNEMQNCLLEEGLRAKMMLQVHDELVFSVPEDEIEHVSSMVKEVMEQVAVLKVPLVADVSSGSNWAEAH